MRYFFIVAAILFNLNATSLNIDNKITLDKKSFKEFHHVELLNSSVLCLSGAMKIESKDLKGVLLMDLLLKSKLSSLKKMDLNKTVFLLKASDGYAASFSYNELFNTNIGNEVIIILDKDKFVLYSKKDFVTGPRYIKDLRTIEVKVLK